MTEDERVACLVRALGHLTLTIDGWRVARRLVTDAGYGR